MAKVTCIHPLGIEGGETYQSGIEYEIDAEILKEYARAFSDPKTTTKKDASRAKENK